MKKLTLMVSCLLTMAGLAAVSAHAKKDEAPPTNCASVIQALNKGINDGKQHPMTSSEAPANPAPSSDSAQ